jgi:hypothetical protein
MKNKEISDYNDKIDNPPPPYTKEDLNDLLKRHSAQVINPRECECECPFTGNSIQILIKFVGAHNDIDTKIIDKAVKVAAKLSKTQCIIGDRKVTAAAILHYTSIMMRMNMIQRTVADLFYVTDVSIRKRRRQLFGEPKSNISISNKRRKRVDKMKNKITNEIIRYITGGIEDLRKPIYEDLFTELYEKLPIENEGELEKLLDEVISSVKVEITIGNKSKIVKIDE